MRTWLAEADKRRRPEAYASFSYGLYFMEDYPKKSSTGSIGFQPVDKLSITKRNLPHWQEPGRVYFISWHCRKGNKLSPEARAITLNAIRYWDGSKWKVYAAVVMPDHVHILAEPFTLPDGKAVNLAEIIHSVKSFSAQKINQLRGLRGAFWQQERFDRIIRNEEEFLEKWQYIRNNPIKQELASRPEECPWFYERP